MLLFGSPLGGQGGKAGSPEAGFSTLIAEPNPVFLFHYFHGRALWHGSTRDFLFPHIDVLVDNTAGLTMALMGGFARIGNNVGWTLS